MPTIYVVTSDSTLALITGKGKTLKKYTLKEDLALRKADMILKSVMICSGARIFNNSAKQILL